GGERGGRRARLPPPPPRLAWPPRGTRGGGPPAPTPAAPSRASSCATTAPIPDPPPVTTATQPSNLGKHRLLQNRSQRLDELRSLGRSRGGGVAEIRAWPARRREGARTGLDRAGQGMGIGDQRLA